MQHKTRVGAVLYIRKDHPKPGNNGSELLHGGRPCQIGSG